MFSTTQIDMINGLSAPMRAEGYVYYLAYTDNNKTNSSDPDLYIYFSKEEIFGTDLNSYFIPSDSKFYSIRTSNSSSYNNTGARITVSDVELAENISVDDLEFISTNASFTSISEVQPDFTVGEVTQYETQGALLFVVCVFLCFFAFTKLFRRW